MQPIDVKTSDGSNQVIYSESFIIYEGKLVIENLLDSKFIFIFEKEDPLPNQKDINIVWTNNEALVTLSNKLRNSLGSGTKDKIEILKTEDSKSISLSVFGQKFGEDGLVVLINFYLA